MVTEGDLTLDVGHTMQHIDDTSYNCTAGNLYNLISQCHPNTLD